VAELTETERRIVAAAETGSPLDLADAPDRDVRAVVVRDLLAGGHGLRLDNMRVVGPLDLEGVRIGGAVRLVQCELPDPVLLRGAALPLLDLRRCALSTLSASEASIERVLLLSGITTTGRLDLSGARVGAACSLQGAILRCSDGPALIADRLRLSSELLLDRLVAEGSGLRGAVRLQGARIDGRISGHAMRITNPSGPALLADSMQVADTVYLSKGSVLRGRGERGAVRIVGARVGSLSLGYARLENPSGWALAAHYLDVTGTLYLDRVDATGGIRVSGGRIGGQLDLTGAQVDGGALPALAATRLQVAQAVVLDDARLLTASPDRAAADFRSARVAGDLEASRTALHNGGGGPALRLASATVDGAAVLSRLEVTGDLNLRGAALGSLHDDPASLPAGVRLRLDGLTYRGLPGGVDTPSAQERIRWLARMPAYAAQPYRQLAAAYQAAGHPEEARRVLVAQQEHLRRSGRLTSRWSRLRHRLFGLTLDYGYQPLRAVALLALTLLAAVGLFLGLAGGTAAEPAGGRCAAVDRVGLAIDTAVPLVSTGADDRCRLTTDTGAGQALAAAGWVLTLLGWGSATLVVAGYTGLVRRP
jgi:hypothetical protein